MLDEDRATTARAISEAEAWAHVQAICFKTGPPRRLGVELEFLVRDAHAPSRPLDRDRHSAAVADLRSLPLRSPLTFEPGGQLELSPPPAPSLTACVAEAEADLDLVRATLRAHDLTLVGHGCDPYNLPVRFLDQPRYAAMEAYFDRRGPAGRLMMCSSASVQVCVDAGYEEPGPLGFARRWRLAHLLGAVLVAAFANSPLRGGRPTGWRSTRQANWADLDPGRSQAPAEARDPRTAWAAYVLDAPVMCVRCDEGPWTVPTGVSFRQWIRATGDHGAATSADPAPSHPPDTDHCPPDTGPGTALPRPPTREDLDYHVSTLFPPVRPRGHLELRMIDAQSGDDAWRVPLAVTTALFDDPEASERVYRAVKPLAELAGPHPPPRNPLWRTAARDALTDPELHAAALAAFAAAREALPRLGASPRLQSAVADFTDRYVARGRCPADDVLDALLDPRPGDPVSGKEGRR
ncbi:glutamate-cysteine ligase family protein [Streptomyces pathocidini]|uniref:Glutamate--cysteine ligase EgtA n=3 Tax=Streptomyces pathocidini TaxID=1650571 RepID=A0ABW7UPN1_9ACTN